MPRNPPLDGPTPEVLEKRIRRLEGIARQIEPDQLTALIEATKTQQYRRGDWCADERFWFSGKAGVTFARDEDRALRSLWTRMSAGLAFAAAGQDVDASANRPGLLGRLGQLLVPQDDFRVEASATAVIERALGGSIWTGVVGVWNAFCAALLPERFDPALRAQLEASWRAVIGTTPLEMLHANSSDDDR